MENTLESEDPGRDLPIVLVFTLINLRIALWHHRHKT